MKLLVCGDRRFTDFDKVESAMLSILNLAETNTIIEGEAKGADTTARLVAEKHGIECKGFPANWSRYGRAAGPIRNKQMLVEGEPDAVLAFLSPESRGTRNMVNQAKSLGLKVTIVEI